MKTFFAVVYVLLIAAGIVFTAVLLRWQAVNHFGTVAFFMWLAVAFMGIALGFVPYVIWRNRRYF